METLETQTETGGVILNPPRRIVPSKKWVFTLNNYTPLEMETLETQFKKLNAKYGYGKEVGESGTPHLQGWVNFEKKVRPIETINIKRIHWEKMRGKVEDSITYCSKDGEYASNARIPRIDKVVQDFQEENLYEWQKAILALYREEPDRRSVYWFWESVGNVGKSFYTKWLYMHNIDDVKVITVTKSSDIVLFADVYTKMYILDIPRSVEMMQPWAALEQLKNGFITEAKLKKSPKITCCAPPHVVVFSNFPPKVEQMSIDRILVTNIADFD